MGEYRRIKQGQDLTWHVTAWLCLLRAHPLFWVSIFYCTTSHFSVASATHWPWTTTQADHLVVSKDALNKPFLLRASLIPQTPVPTSTATLSRIVFLKRKGARVFLLESTQGQIVTSQLKSQILLTEIPVVAENESTLTLDFNSGMQRVFTALNWDTADAQPTDAATILDETASLRSMASKITHSYIDSLQNVIGGDQSLLDIRQIIQIDDEESFPSYEVRYIISPYEPKRDYKILERPAGSRRFGFFEIPPLIEPSTGRQSFRITKWHIPSRPDSTITYYISANTPLAYRQAITEGILYWNRAFGAPILQVAMAPESVTAPDPTHNLVQWVDWDQAELAYADAITDPLTGEILNAQIYLTSVMAFNSKQHIRRVLRGLSETGGVSQPAHAANARVAHRGRLCHFHKSAPFSHALERILELDLDDETILHISQAYVRNIVAHEVGHTLGLSHNFAGKLAANISLNERDQIFFKVLGRSKVPALNRKRASSTVMDYLSFRDEIITGAQLAATDEALPYDRMAIQWGYFGANFRESNSSKTLYCTDSDLGVYLDCNEDQSGPESLRSNAWQIRNHLEQLPYRFLERFIAAVAPADPRDQRPLGEVAVSPSFLAQQLGQLMARQIAWLHAESRSAYIEQGFSHAGRLHRDQVKAKQWQWLQSQIESLGGVESVFFSLLQQATQASAPERFQNALQRLQKRGFQGLDGSIRKFTARELKTIQNQLLLFTNQFHHHLVDAMLDAYLQSKVDLELRVNQSMERPTETNGESISHQYESQLGRFAQTILFEQGPRELIATGLTHNHFKARYAVRAYKYSHELRLKAARLLSRSLGASPDWSLDARRTAIEKLSQDLEHGLGREYSEIHPHEFERPLRGWILQQREILRILAREPGCEDLLETLSVKRVHGEGHEENEEGEIAAED